MSQRGASPRRPGQSPPSSSRCRSSSRGPPVSPTRSQAGSVSGSGPSNPFGKSLGFDPARSEAGRDEAPVGNRRLELPPEAYMVVSYPQYAVSKIFFLVLTYGKNPLDSRFAKRPGYNAAGKKINVEVNQYAMIKRKDNFKVFQYDVR